MAKQAGPYFITGCIDNICFYQLDGQYYARTKSCLEGKRVKHDPAFKETMRYAGLMGQASRLASVVYRQLAREQKGKGLFKRLTGKTFRLLKAGVSPTDVEFLLRIELGLIPDCRVKLINQKG